MEKRLPEKHGPRIGDLKRPLSFIFAVLLFIAIFVGSLVLVVVVYEDAPTSLERDLAWWKRTIIYHVYIPSYLDTNGDGYGDLNGVREKLDHIQSLGVDSIWLSPFYEFGGKDMGNDVINHTAVDPLFGNQTDLDNLFEDIEQRGMHIILEFIPNHTSNISMWFTQSVENPKSKYGDYYIWKGSNRKGVDGEPLPPNDWICATGQSAWEYNEIRDQWYFHSFLPDMPDLNLHSGGVREEIMNIMNYWLSKPPVLGFHLGGFNILFEDEEENTGTMIKTNITAGVEFLIELHSISKTYTDIDGLDRLFLLKFYSRENDISEVAWQAFIRNSTKGVAELPFSFGDLTWRINGSVDGYALEKYLKTYLDKGEDIFDWPCWELNDHDAISGQGDFDFGRIPKDVTDAVLITTMLLPGTTIIYYGDEIGMANTTNISFEDTRDPYARPPYANETTFKKKSRDPFRTPMHWNSDANAGFTTAEKPWLPVADDYTDVNVESQKNNAKNGTQLVLFHQLNSLRHHKALHSGKVYFPYSNTNIFSFIRKDDTDGTAFLVVTNIGRNMEVAEKVDFTVVMPQMSNKGDVIVTSTLNKNTHIKKGSIYMENVTLFPKETVVIMLDYDG